MWFLEHSERIGYEIVFSRQRGRAENRIFPVHQIQWSRLFGQSGGGSPVASVVKGTGAVSKSSGISAATALSQLKQAKDMVACLPEVTDTPSLDTISSVSDAVSSIVGTVSAGVSAVGEVLVAAKKKINDAVEAIIPQPVHEAISSIQENVRELREVGLYVLDTSSAITALPIP